MCRPEDIWRYEYSQPIVSYHPNALFPHTQLDYITAPLVLTLGSNKLFNKQSALFIQNTVQRFLQPTTLLQQLLSWQYPIVRLSFQTSDFSREITLLSKWVEQCPGCTNLHHSSSPEAVDEATAICSIGELPSSFVWT